MKNKFPFIVLTADEGIDKRKFIDCFGNAFVYNGNRDMMLQSFEHNMVYVNNFVKERKLYSVIYSMLNRAVSTAFIDPNMSDENYTPKYMKVTVKDAIEKLKPVVKEIFEIPIFSLETYIYGNTGIKVFTDIENQDDLSLLRECIKDVNRNDRIVFVHLRDVNNETGVPFFVPDIPLGIDVLDKESYIDASISLFHKIKFYVTREEKA